MSRCGNVGRSVPVVGQRRQRAEFPVRLLGCQRVVIGAQLLQRFLLAGVDLGEPVLVQIGPGQATFRHRLVPVGAHRAELAVDRLRGGQFLVGALAQAEGIELAAELLAARLGGVGDAHAHAFGLLTRVLEQLALFLELGRLVLALLDRLLSRDIQVQLGPDLVLVRQQAFLVRRERLAGLDVRDLLLELGPRLLAGGQLFVDRLLGGQRRAGLAQLLEHARAGVLGACPLRLVFVFLVDGGDALGVLLRRQAGFLRVGLEFFEIVVADLLARSHALHQRIDRSARSDPVVLGTLLGRLIGRLLGVADDGVVVLLQLGAIGVERCLKLNGVVALGPRLGELFLLLRHGAIQAVELVGRRIGAADAGDRIPRLLGHIGQPDPRQLHVTDVAAHLHRAVSQGSGVGLLRERCRLVGLAGPLQRGNLFVDRAG